MFLAGDEIKIKQDDKGYYSDASTAALINERSSIAQMTLMTGLFKENASQQSTAMINQAWAGAVGSGIQAAGQVVSTLIMAGSQETIAGYVRDVEEAKITAYKDVAEYDYKLKDKTLNVQRELGKDALRVQESRDRREFISRLVAISAKQQYLTDQAKFNTMAFMGNPAVSYSNYSNV